MQSFEVLMPKPKEKKRNMQSFEVLMLKPKEICKVSKSECRNLKKKERNMQSFEVLMPKPKGNMQSFKV
jgi:hypothetical protein